MIPKVLASILFLLFYIPLNAQNAVYKIEFISNWSALTHPNQYPSSAHWSPLVGANHNVNISLFNTGQLATDGVEQVAETGSTTTIETEINNAISNNTAYNLIKGSGLNSGPGTITIDDVEINMEFPLISLITMIAPSPDWVAQVNSVELTDASNDWISELTVDVFATDAGTDDGSTYTSDNSDTNPAVNMFSLQNTTPFSDQIVGTFKFTLQSVLSVHDSELANAISVYPNPNNGMLYIGNPSLRTLEKVEIFTVNGQKVKEFTQIHKNNNLNVTSLQSGLYFLKLKSKEESIVKKIIIQ